MSTSNAGGGATSDGQADQLAELEAIEQNTAAVAGTVTSGIPTSGDSSIAVALKPGSIITAIIDASQSAFAQPSEGAQGVVTYTVGLAPAVPAGEEGSANPVIIRGVASIAGTVDQGKANPDEKWSVTDVDTQAAVAAVQTAIEALGGSATIADIVSLLVADVATQSAILAELQAHGLSLGTIIGHLASIDASAATTATNTGATVAAVTSLEAEVADDATTADVQAVGTAVGAVEVELQDKATEATLATRASETTAVSTLAAVDTLEGNTDQVEPKLEDVKTKLDGINDGVPAALGQTSMANSMPVVLPSDQMRTSTPLDATSGLPTRPIPGRTSSVITAPGTPAASLIVRAGPCWLRDIFVSNQSTTTACYVTLYDAVVAPSHGSSAAARKIVGRHIDTKIASDPFNHKETYNDMYFAIGCVIVLEMAENDATVNTSGAPTCAMNATFIPAT